MSESEHKHITLKPTVTSRIQLNVNTTREVTSGVTNVLDHDMMTLKFPLPLFEFEGYRVSASPVSNLTGSTLTLSLSEWTFFDHERNRPILGVVLPIEDPNGPAAWNFVRLYVRTARHLDADQIAQWGKSVMDGMRDTAAELAVQAFAEGGDKHVDADS